MKNILVGSDYNSIKNFHNKKHEVSKYFTKHIFHISLAIFIFILNEKDFEGKKSNLRHFQKRNHLT